MLRESFLKRGIEPNAPINYYFGNYTIANADNRSPETPALSDNGMRIFNCRSNNVDSKGWFTAPFRIYNANQE